jgi:5'-nucleotidase
VKCTKKAGVKAICMLTVGLTLTLMGSASSAAGRRDGQSTREPLRILLSNDDGVGQGGLPALQEALCKAGHEVVVSAPSANRSGNGGSITGSGTIDVLQSTTPCGSGSVPTYAVSGTPADSVLFGLTVMPDPDVVVTGINPGQNIAGAMSISGTIGASMASAKQGIATISVSVENDAEDLARNGNLGQTTAALPDAADYTARLINRLAARAHGRELLPAGLLVNVAYPVVLDARGKHDPSLVKGTRVTNAGTYPVLGGFGQYKLVERDGNVSTYSVSSPGFCRLQFECPGETVRNADSDGLEAGYVSVTPLETHFGAESERGTVTRLLRGI